MPLSLRFVTVCAFPATDPYPQPDEFSPNPHTTFNIIMPAKSTSSNPIIHYIHFNIITLSTLSLLLHFPNNTMLVSVSQTHVSSLHTSSSIQTTHHLQTATNPTATQCTTYLNQLHPTATQCATYLKQEGPLHQQINIVPSVRTISIPYRLYAQYQY
jgi:hypothetical protein